MKYLKLLPVALMFCTVSSSLAQNPYKSLGIPDEDVKILTLSDGRYDEIQEWQEFERVGSAIINMRTMKISHFVDRDTMRSEATFEPEIVSRWLSPDPIARQFPELTPYQFGSNNPIWNIDLEGLEGVPFLLRPFFLSPGGIIMQKATVNTIFVVANRNLTDVNRKFSASEIKVLKSNATHAKTYQYFTSKIQGMTLKEVKHAYDIEKTGKLQSDLSAEGPSKPKGFRYIEDPANPEVIIDMRHFFVIGSSVPSQAASETYGLAVEIVQDIGNQKSAYNIQDYFSNQLGAEFFNEFYDPKSEQSLSEQLNIFFKERESEAQNVTNIKQD